MFERILVSKLAERLHEPRGFIEIVVGPRQTGKTTAVLQVLENLRTTTHYVSADDPVLASTEWLRNEWEQARALAKSGGAVLVVDEVQKISKKLYPEALSLIIGSANLSLEDFLLGKKPLFI